MKASDVTEEGDLDRPLTPIVSEAELNHWFTYHPPREGQRERYELLREQGKQLARLICESTPPGHDQLAAIRKVREAIMTANAAIACEHEVQTAYYARKLTVAAVPDLQVADADNIDDEGAK